MTTEPWDEEKPDHLIESLQQAIESIETTAQKFYSSRSDGGEDSQDDVGLDTIQVMEGTAKVLQKILRLRRESLRMRKTLPNQQNRDDNPDAS